MQLPAMCGMGGRNQHYAVVTLTAMQEYSHEWVAASVGTDGSDYLPEVAGAIVDNFSLDKLIKHNIEIQPYLERCDSHSLLKKLNNSLIKTGGTGTNVGDVVVYLIKS